MEEQQQAGPTPPECSISPQVLRCRFSHAGSRGWRVVATTRLAPGQAIAVLHGAHAGGGGPHLGQLCVQPASKPAAVAAGLQASNAMASSRPAHVPCAAPDPLADCVLSACCTGPEPNAVMASTGLQLLATRPIRKGEELTARTCVRVPGCAHALTSSAARLGLTAPDAAPDAVATRTRRSCQLGCSGWWRGARWRARCRP